MTQVERLEVRAVDPTDEAGLDAFLEVYAAAERAEDPAARLYSRADAASLLGSRDPSSFFAGYGAFVGGEVLGVAILTGSTRDNVALAQAQAWVHPAHRRGGVGTRLVDHVERQAASRGRTLVRVQVRTSPGLEDNQRFAEGRGYRLALVEVERRLALPPDEALLGRLAAEAAPHHTDYEIRTVVGPVPVGLRASYVDLDNLLLVEMPHGDVDLQATAGTVADLDAFEAEQVGAGRTRVSAFAVHDGGVVAFADASVPDGERHVDQLGTLVHPAHRGHRLGMAVKCAQLRLLRETFPDRTSIATSNAEVNLQMVAINEALGFEIHQVWAELEKRIDPVPSEMG
ncbi:MAG TPA: GNAT family N-acetyltransferase [Nocardioides sp.]|nr:GNAT family N-acetyltransferase [Nocardioides sp.]